MKSTNALNVKTNLYVKDDLLMHPDDGFELGLMNTSHCVKLFFDATIEVFNQAEKDFINANLILSNDCKRGEIILSHKYWKKIGSPHSVKLFFESSKVLLSSIRGK